MKKPLAYFVSEKIFTKEAIRVRFKDTVNILLNPLTSTTLFRPHPLSLAARKKKPK